MKDKKLNNEELSDIVNRLTNENSSWRKTTRDTEAIIRKRYPKADGLSLQHSVKTILDDRDKQEETSTYYKEQLQKIYKLLLEDKAEEAKQYLNIFLFKTRQ